MTQQETFYFIVLRGQESLAWSNDSGWVEGEEFDLFSETEKQTVTLPMGGEWREAFNI